MACCALPVLIAAGVVGAGVVSWLPALAVAALFEFGGAWLVRQSIREHKGGRPPAVLVRMSG